MVLPWWYINALSDEFNALNAPFVVATIGFGGEPLATKPTDFQQVFNAQMAVQDLPQFAGIVKSINILKYWRTIAESPKNEDYHYNQNAETYMLVGDAMGRAMLEMQDDTTPPRSPYETWATGRESFDGDANGDGVPDGIAWMLGAGDPSAKASALLPVPRASGGGLTISFHMRNAASRGGSVLQVQYTGDIVAEPAWTSSTVPETSGKVGEVDFTITPDGGLNHVIATIPESAAINRRLFGRLKASE